MVDGPYDDDDEDDGDVRRDADRDDASSQPGQPGQPGVLVRRMSEREASEPIVVRAWSDDDAPDDTGDLSVDDSIEALPRGFVLGRYVLLGRIAVGGRGVVYAAFDPDLDRKIALKLIGVPVDVDDVRERLLQSARAAAKIVHPAVVRILRVGTFEGGIYVAMEFVDGLDLRRWMEARDDPFPWREVLRIFREAGRGLAAAHAQGVVHGDFKPDNVLLGKGGRICVIDFGLSDPPLDDGADVQLSELRAAYPGTLSNSEQSSSEEVGTGPAPGTPAYMAPEQHIGIQADAKSDQFSFCVAFYEALYGERPFAGERRGAIAMEAMHHRVRPSPPQADVPPWLRAVLLRGLDPRRSERYPSMEALLRELDRDPIARRRRWVKGLAVLTTLGGASGAVFYMLYLEAQRCMPDGSELAGVWDAERRDGLRDAFVAAGHPQAEQIWTTVESTLDEWASEWIEYRERACRVTRVRGDAPEELFAQRTACLDARLNELRAFGRVYEDVTAASIADAPAVARSLTLPSACVRETVLRMSPVPPEEQAEAIDEARQDLADAALTFAAGDSEHARARAQRVGVSPLVDEDPTLLVGAELLVGRIEQALGRPREAEAALHRAGTLAQEHGLLEFQARAWTELADLLWQVGRGDEADRWAAYAWSTSTRLADDALRGRVLRIRGDIARTQGRDGDALSQYHLSLEQLERAYGADDPRLVEALVRLGSLVIERGDPASATRYFERARTLLQTQGLGHGRAMLDVTLGTAAMTLAAGRVDDALAQYELTISSVQPSDPVRAAALAQALLASADIHAKRGEAQAAATAHEKAIEVLEHAPDPRALAHALERSAEFELASGRAERARARLERALEIRERYPAQAVELARTRFSLARASWDGEMGRERAVTLARSAAEALRAAGPTHSAELTTVDGWLGEHSPR